MDPVEARRHDMVARQIAGRGVRDERVLDAMRSVPRERFVGEALAEFTYDDAPLPIGEGQTISQPYIVAAMIEAAAIGAGDRVLEVGAGSGYAAAVLDRIAGRVFAVERHEGLCERAGAALAAVGAKVELRTGDGTEGWPDRAPFDAIVVSAGGPEAPQSLKDQLALGGRLVMPVGDREEQRLLKLTRVENGFELQDLGTVAFVPLIGAEGWGAG